MTTQRLTGGGPAVHRRATDGPWHRVARATGLLGADGVVAASVFTEMSALAQRTGALNLGQGFPDDDGPEFLRELAAAAVRGGPDDPAGLNQYPPGPGLPALRQAVATHQERHYGLTVDPDTEEPSGGGLRPFALDARCDDQDGS